MTTIKLSLVVFNGNCNAHGEEKSLRHVATVATFLVETSLRGISHGSQFTVQFHLIC